MKHRSVESSVVFSMLARRDSRVFMHKKKIITNCDGSDKVHVVIGDHIGRSV